MNEKQLHGYESPDTEMLCPTEGWAYLGDGIPYHKLWWGCGWVGPRNKCVERQHGPTMLSSIKWIDYRCPKCRTQVENRQRHEAELADLSTVPPMPAIFRKTTTTGEMPGGSPNLGNY